MKHSINSWPTKVSLGILGLLGTSGLLSQSAIAASIPLTGATTSVGGVNPLSGLVCTSGTSLSATFCTTETVQDVLTGGSASAPGGNVELQVNTETNVPPFNFNTDFTVLSGDIGGSPFLARSLTANDWGVGPGSLTRQWLTDAFAANGIPLADINAVEALFLANDGRERFSDPNVSYAFENNGFLHVGLAGFLNAADLFADSGFPLPPGTVIQASELVFLEYKDISGVFYSFDATNAGQSADDGNATCPGGAPS